jgi:hypothetical protein
MGSALSKREINIKDQFMLMAAVLKPQESMPIEKNDLE